MKHAYKNYVKSVLFRALPIVLVLFGSGVPVARAFRQPEHSRAPDFDARKDASSTPLPSREQTSAVNRLKAQLPTIQVHFEAVRHSPRFIMAQDGFLSGPGGQGWGIATGTPRPWPADDPHRAIKAFLDDHADLFGHGAEVLEATHPTRDYVDGHNGQRTVVWEQQFQGITVFEAVLIGHITRKGELVNLSSLFLPNLLAAAATGTPNHAALLQTPLISASEALIGAIRCLDKSAEGAVTMLEPPAGAEKRQKLIVGSLRKAAELRLVWLPTRPAAMRLCWEVILTEPDHGETYRILVDAGTGEMLLRRCLTVYLSNASFRVYTSDSPSPFSPGHPLPLTTQPPQVSRVLVVTNAANTNASPRGWIDDGVNETRGNNADAHLDRNDDDQPDLPRPQGSPFRVFDFPMDLSQDPITYGDAAVVQLFYWCNWVHDQFWELGFTEPAGNFQNDNFGRGGVGNDAVQADAQDGSGFNNANFTYAADGNAPRVQMYIFNGANPHRDGDFDAEVVLHECTHGLSGRLVGGGIGVSLTQSAGMGEGWSDWYALAFLSDPGDDPNGNYAMGAYITYRFSGLTQNYYSGIRRYPYSTDLAKNPLTFKDIDPAQASGHPGVPVSSVFGGVVADEVHAQGEVWCVTLWEARAKLINKHGFAVGNRLALQLVTDGMKLSPPNPNFLEARDAILQADQVLTGGGNHGELWAAFAKRGMGFSATSPSSSTTLGVQESFDLPDDLRISPVGQFLPAGALGGPFTPSSIIYTLTNLGSNVLGWSATSGTFVALSATAGSLAPNGASINILVTLSSGARNLPPGVYSDTVVFSNRVSGAVQRRKVSLRLGQPDYFTEIFDTGNNDFRFQSLTFTPDGSTNFYSACRAPVTNFPTSPVGGVNLALGDDTFAQITLADSARVWLYGVSYSSLFVNANGNITFIEGDSSYAESTGTHFSQPRVSALFRDLNPAVGGAITWKQLSDRLAVTWQNVPEYGKANANSFQIEMFFDGRIRLTDLAIAADYGLAGLSAGGGEPPGFTKSDLSAYEPCVSSLVLTIPKTLSENLGVLPNQASVSIPEPLPTNLVVSLESSDPSQITVPPSTTVVAGQTSAIFGLSVLDNSLLDGSRIIRISATAPGFRKASDTLWLHDNETATLSVTLPASAIEGDGILPGAGRVTLSAPADRAVVVYFTLSNTDALSAPVPLIIPVGQTSATFDLNVLDNLVSDGMRTASLTARVENWREGTASMTVLDNDTPPLTIAHSGTNLLLSWPSFYPGFILEVNTNATATGVWQTITNSLESANGEFRTLVSPAKREQLFRLRRL